MKKFLAAVFMTLALFATGLVAAPAASATPASEAQITAKAFKASVPAVHVTPEKRNIGGGVTKPLYRWLDSSYCYWSGISTRSYYCYRYACTYFERVAWGCYDGYVRMTTYTFV